MSKPIARVVFSTLIALALVVGIYTSVLAFAKNGQARLAAGAKHGLVHQRAPVQGLDTSDTQMDAYDKGEGGCHSESMIDPDD